MKRSCLLLCVVLGSGSLARAQAPGQAEPASATFLEKRVPDELASEGLVLSRRNLGLQVEQFGDKWLVSLVDLTTSRVAASTKIEVLPADREAAVAAMTHVVAELAEQLSGPRDVTPVAPPAAALPAPANDEPAWVAKRERAEIAFKRQAIRFGASYEIVGSGTSVALARRWEAYQGDLDQTISPQDFYRQVGRPDLVKAYEARRSGMITAFVLGTLASVGGIAWIASQDRSDLDHEPSPVGPLLLITAGSISWGVGYYLYFKPHPISENEAKSLADGYNQNLRRKLGLATVSQAPRLRDVKLAPYVGEHDGGLVIAARF